MARLSLGKVLVALLLFSPLASARAATNTAASPSFIDVSNAVHSATAGDTILIPAGTVTWTNTLTITKGLTLIGAGADATFITNLIELHGMTLAFTLTSGTSFRVSGIYFDCNWDHGGGAIGAYTRGYQDSWKTFNYITGFRIDHCVFDRCWFAGGYGAAPLEMYGRVWGVVDNCSFFDGVYAARVYGNPISEAQAQSYGWPADTSGTADWSKCETNLLYYLGTTNNFVLESCLIATRNPAYSPPPNGARLAVSSAWTAHYVFRHNIVSNIYDNGFNDVLDLHGNKEIDGTFRGAICAEVYNNTVYSTNNAYRFAYFRGGTCLAYSNSVFGVSSAAASIQLEEEEPWNNVGPVNTNWPWVDAITNSYFYANTYNLTNTVVPQLSSYLYAVVPNAFQEGRDYWLSAPSGALAAYTPLTYPHPLAGGTPGPSPEPTPTPPSGNSSSIGGLVNFSGNVEIH